MTLRSPYSLVSQRERLLADLHRLVEAVEAIDLDDPPRGRRAARALNQIELARSDAEHHLCFFVEWLTGPGTTGPDASDSWELFLR